MTSKKGLGPCIYTTPAGLCPGRSPLHPKEHYLPAGLGNFKSDIRLRDLICTECQQSFATLEDVFLHNSPEAFFRFITGIPGRKHHRRKDIFYEPTAGMAPITVKALQPGQSYPVLWEMTGVQEARQMKQLVFKNDKSDFYHLPYRPGRLAWALKEFTRQHTGENIELVSYFCDGGIELEEIRSKCASFMIGKQEQHLASPVGQNIQAEMRAAVSVPYLRTVAKIAFHFVLAHFDFSGHERQFDQIKRFIFTGENYKNVVQRIDQQFVHELRDPRAFTKTWCHLLSAQYDYNFIESRMQFFCGPVVKPFVWRVMLGPSPARLHGTYSKAFLYRYFGHVDRQGYSGEMEPLERRHAAVE